MPGLIPLKLNKEFKRAYFQGKFKAHPLLVSYRVKNRSREVRIGITTSKKIGCAVRRNRARRIIRQAFFELCRENPGMYNGFDYVFVARERTPLAKTPEVKDVMRRELDFLRRL